jgi:hemolysin III
LLTALLAVLLAVGSRTLGYVTSGPIPEVLATSAVKPRLRGRLHQVSFVVSLAAGSALVTASATMTSSPSAVAAMAVYVVTVLGLFGISALYHRFPWPTESARSWMRRLDHSMIYLFIAGTYTPITELALRSTSRVVVLAVVWAGAVGGVLLNLAWPRAPRWVGVPIYLALGWVAVFVLPELLRQAGVAALVLLLVGGALYTLGAVCYAVKRPDPWPAVFGYHEVFHAATVLAALCHYLAVWFVLVRST